MTIAFPKEMSVDGDAIDNDHRVLTDIINAFREVWIIGVALCEEKLQAAILYPHRDAHHRERQELIRRLTGVRRS